MHMISRQLLFFSLVILFAAVSCKKNDNQNVVPNYYTGSGTAGDVLSFTVNESAMGYTIFNESNRRYTNGSFTIYSGELNGLYKVFTNGAFYYAVEIPGQVFTGNFPTARLNNNMAFGVSMLANADGARIAGNYVYLHIGNSAVNGSTQNREWGILTMMADGSWLKQGYCNMAGVLPGLMPDEYTGTVPPPSPSDTGSWSVDPIYPDRLRMNQMNVVDTLTGFSHVGDSGAVFVMDMGFGRGFLIGLRLFDGNQNTLKGSYGYADVRYDAATGGGKFAVSDSTGMIDWWRGDSYGKIRNGTFEALTQSPVLKNVYYAKNVLFYGDLVDIYTIVSGPFFMEFQFQNNKFRSYGTGGRLP